MLLMDCAVEAPPVLTGDSFEDKRALVGAYVSQTYNLAKCNEDKQSLREWKLEQKQIYEKE
jgi:hypothetical protein